MAEIIKDIRGFLPRGAHRESSRRSLINCEEIPSITVFAGPGPAEKVSGAGVIGVPSTLIPPTFPWLTSPPRFCYTYHSFCTPALAVLFFKTNVRFDAMQ
jgi:hypothetical protein